MSCDVEAVVEETLAQVGEDFWSADLHRLLGELYLAGDSPQPETSELHFERAKEIARNQRSRGLELRLASSRLRHADGGQDTETRRLDLEAIYDRFDEGFDTLDLRRARRLLETTPR